jgi:hypothetical protein
MTDHLAPENLDHQELVEPASIEEAEELRIRLVSDLQAIQSQLGNEDDDRTSAEFEAWRRRAKVALKYKVADVQRVNTWIKNYRRNHRGNVGGPLEAMSVGELAQGIAAMADELAKRVRQSQEMRF